MPQITPYDGKTDPKAFIMSFEAAIQSMGGDEAIMAKSFVMAVSGITRTWYTTLDPGKVFSWEQLREAMLENFQGNYDDPVTSGHLFAVKQGKTETLRSFMKRFVHVKCQASGLSERTIIDAAQEGLQPGSLRSRLSRRPPQNVSELMKKMEEYARAEDDELREAQWKGNPEASQRKAERRSRESYPERPKERDDRKRGRDHHRRSHREILSVEEGRRREDPRRSGSEKRPGKSGSHGKQSAGVGLDLINATGTHQDTGTAPAHTALSTRAGEVTTPGTAPPLTTRRPGRQRRGRPRRGARSCMPETPLKPRSGRRRLPRSLRCGPSRHRIGRRLRRFRPQLKNIRGSHPAMCSTSSEITEW